MSRVDTLKKEIAVIQKKIEKTQEKCKHPPRHVRYRFDASTGNWDRGDDCYWTDYHCTLCDKRWRVDDSRRIDGATEAKDRKDL